MNERQPTLDELLYFIMNPRVGGMMGFSDSYPTPEGRGYQSVVMPPDTRLGRDSVKRNETLRLLLQDYAPTSSLSEQQKKSFGGTAYGADTTNLLRSILARIGSGDPSAQATFEQDAEFRKLSGFGGLLGGYGK